jgi:UDP-N-acetylglucosamine acyltransferase
VYEKGYSNVIHPRAIVDSTAELDNSVDIDAYAIIGKNVHIAAGTWIGSHVVIHGPTIIGENNRIYPFASLGEDAQDKKYKGESDTWLDIGHRNVIREYCTLNRGTLQGGGVTRLGDDNWIMAYSHIAHDCQLGNSITFANGSSLAGHVSIDDFVILGGFSLVHQFCSIGAYSFSSAGTIIVQDVPPFVMVHGNRAKVFGLNKEGLKRHQFSIETINHLSKAYKILYKQGLTLEESLNELEKFSVECQEITVLMNFLKKSTRGIVR